MKLSFKWWRWAMIIGFLLFIIISTIFWIINSQGPLATTISVLFVALGLVFSFFQLFYPEKHDPQVSRRSSHSTQIVPPIPTSLSELIPSTSQQVPEATSSNCTLAVPITTTISKSKVANVEKSEETNRFSHQRDWEEAPHIRKLYGYKEELALLEQWILHDACRMVIVLGMGGIGKTTLAAKVTELISQKFEYVFWRSLQNAPLAEDVLKQCLQFLSGQQVVKLPVVLDEQLSSLLKFLREHHCLLVLDNFESVFQDGCRAGQYREGYESYGCLLQRIAEAHHQSCLLLTSREKPKEVARLEGDTSPVRALFLSGVRLTGGQELLRDRGISGSDDSCARLISLYSGNPLALKLIAEVVHDVFGSNIDKFLQVGETVFGDISDLLEQQFCRLTPMEQEILYWLAIERELVLLEDLQNTLIHMTQRSLLLEALSSLRRRCMIEANDTPAFTLLPIILDYVTHRFTSLICDEIANEQLVLFPRHMLMIAQSRDYIRSCQILCIVRPLVEHLQLTFGKEGMREKLKQILTLVHNTPTLAVSYAAGNILNLLAQAYGNLQDYDFSHLTVRQAYLQNVTLTDADFSSTHFVDSVFKDTFGAVLSVAFQPNGELLAMGTASGEIRIWQANKNAPLLSCYGHSDAVWSVAFSPDGRMLASGSQDQTIRLWDVRTGQCLSVIQEQATRVWSIAFSLDGHMLASGREDCTVHIWDVSTQQCIQILQEHSGRVLSVAFSPYSHVLASSSEDASIRLTDVVANKCLRILQCHATRIRSICFRSDGGVLAGGGDDQKVHLWDTETGQHLAALNGHTDTIRSVTFSGKGTLLCSSSDDQTVRLWDTKTRECLTVLQSHTNRVWSVALNHNDRMLASGSEDQTVRLWDVRAQRYLYTLQGHTNWVWSVAFDLNGEILASSDQTVRLWDIRTGRSLQLLQGHTKRVRGVAFHPAKKMLASGSEDQTVRLWDIETGYCLHTLQGHTHWVRSIAFSPDGKLLASGSDDKTIYLWDTAEGSCIRVLKGHLQEIRTIAFHPDGDLLASGSVDQTIRLWHVETGQELKFLQGQMKRVRSLAFSPRGDILASGGSDKNVYLWDIYSSRCLAILKGHIHEIRAIAFSPDGMILASSSEDQTIRLWEINTGHCFAVLHGHNSRVRSVAFHPDGSKLASGSDDGTIKLWNVQNGVCLMTLRSDRPYERMKIGGATGLTEGQKVSLQLLGAVEVEY